MNYLLLSPELFRHEGGIARILRLYLQALCESTAAPGRVDSVVLNDDPAPDPRLAHYTNDRFGVNVGCARRKGRFLRETLRLSRHADLIVCGHLHQLPIAWLAAGIRRRLKYCLVAHGIEVWRPYSRLERRALLGADRILCVSEYTRRQLLRFCPQLSPARLVVVPNALDPHLTLAAGTGSAPALFAVPRILAVGRLSQADAYKGFDTLIEAMAILRRESPTARLRIVGTGDDRPRLEALARRPGIAGSVDFLGALTDEALAAEYAACDLFALPSRREGFGLVYVEAMAGGKPCLAARAGGAPEVVNSDVGLLVDYGNVPAIAAGLADLMAYPRDSEVVRRHADSFALPAFRRRLAAALA